MADKPRDLSDIQAVFATIFGKVLEDYEDILPGLQAEAMAYIEHNTTLADGVRQEYRENLVEAIYHWIRENDDALSRSIIEHIRQEVLTFIEGKYPEIDLETVSQPDQDET